MVNIGKNKIKEFLKINKIKRRFLELTCIEHEKLLNLFYEIKKLLKIIQHLPFLMMMIIIKVFKSHGNQLDKKGIRNKNMPSHYPKLIHSTRNNWDNNQRYKWMISTKRLRRYSKWGTKVDMFFKYIRPYLTGSVKYRFGISNITRKGISERFIMVECSVTTRVVKMDGTLVFTKHNNPHKENDLHVW